MKLNYKFLIVPILLLAACAAPSATAHLASAKARDAQALASKDYIDLVDVAAKGFLDLGRKIATKDVNLLLSKTFSENNSESPAAKLKVDVTAILASDVPNKPELINQAVELRNEQAAQLALDIHKQYMEAWVAFEAEVNQFKANALSAQNFGIAEKYISAVTDYLAAVSERDAKVEEVINSVIDSTGLSGLKEKIGGFSFFSK